MQLTTTNGKDIYVNPNYIFKIEPTQNGSLLSFEVEKFVLQDLQDIEVSQTPERLTELLKECLTVQLLNATTIYLNRRYVFKILAQENYTEIYISIKDIAQKYRVYQVSNTVEDLISQIPTSSEGGSDVTFLQNYIDGRVTRIVKKLLPSFPTVSALIEVQHNLNDENVQIEVWGTSAGKKQNITNSPKLNIYKESEGFENKFIVSKTDDLSGITDIEIRVYSYPNAIVTRL